MGNFDDVSVAEVFNYEIDIRFMANIKGRQMVTQVAILSERMERAKVRLGEDAPIVKALQRQLDGYRSMKVNHEQNFLAGTIPKILDKRVE